VPHCDVTTDQKVQVFELLYLVTGLLRVPEVSTEHTVFLFRVHVKCLYCAVGIEPLNITQFVIFNLLKLSGHYVYRTQVTLCTAILTFNVLLTVLLSKM